MTGSVEETVPLNQLSDGDEISVSERDTPMTVVSVSENRDGPGVKVIAENRHGEYRLIQFGDVLPTLRAGSDRRLIGTVRVTYA